MPPRPPLPSQLSLPDAAPEERTRMRAQTMSDFADWLDEMSLDALAERAVHLRAKLKAEPDAKFTAADMSVFERACSKAREMAKRAEECGVRSTECGVEEKKQEGVTQPVRRSFSEGGRRNAATENKDPTDVMPAEAGIQSLGEIITEKKDQDWIPACAGMTHASSDAPSQGTPCSSTLVSQLPSPDISSLCVLAPLRENSSSVSPPIPHRVKHTHNGKTKKSRHKLPRHIRRALERDHHARDPG